MKTLRPVSELKGVVQVPPDKSITHRSLLFSSLAEGISVIKNPLEAADCLSTAACIEALGCRVEKQKGLWKVEGRGLWGYRKPAGILDCGNSGTTIRLLSGILAAQDFETDLTGDDSLRKRPMQRVAQPLTAMGAQFSMRDGKFAPIKIKGTKDLKPIHWKNPVASAQVKSCVLLAGLHVNGETSFEEPSLSRDHTERMLAFCGVSLKRIGPVLSIQGPARIPAREWVVPGDFSSAAFFIAAALLVKRSNVRLQSVNLNPTRTGFLDLVEKMGGVIAKENRRDINGEPVADLIVAGNSHLHSISMDESIAPRLIDEVPILSILATQATGTSVLRGIRELRVKESDRISALAHNLKVMGAQVREEEDGLIIEGPTPLKGGEIESFDDHRIAMAFAIATLIAEGETLIKGSDCVSISYPAFWTTLERLFS